MAPSIVMGSAHWLGLVTLGACGFSNATGSAADNTSDAPPMPGVDAAVIDAPMMQPGPDAFAVTDCPSGYVDIGALDGSRYRVITSNANFWDHHDDCNNDSATTPTHLVVVNSQAEADLLASTVGTRYFIGATQAPGQTQKAAGWMRFDGGAVASAWAVNSSPSEPSDNDGVEDGDEQVAIADQNGLMHDAGGVTTYRAVCECDGKPIAAGVIIPPRP